MAGSGSAEAKRQSQTPAPAPAISARPAQLEREREQAVKRAYGRYTTLLAKSHGLIVGAVRKYAPELSPRLKKTPPRAVDVGYGILPAIVGDPPKEPETKPVPTTTAYSWPITQGFIDWELTKLDEFQEKLKVLDKIEASERLPVLKKMVEEFAVLEENQQTIDAHLQHNEFWQQAIAADRKRFDRLTVLHDLVLELQAIREYFDAPDEAARRQALPRIRGLSPELPQAALRTELADREARYNAILREEISRIRPVPFLKIPAVTRGKQTIRVPLYTDIADERFLSEFKKAVERSWQVRDSNRTYAVELKLKRAPVKSPRRGARIDIEAHAAKFPKDGAVLTTGAKTTYAIPGRYIALGPQPLSHRVLAHEFGHVLGFIDNYFRGYRDLGADGFEILEIIPDYSDIMAATATGDVLPRHFERLIEVNAKRAR